MTEEEKIEIIVESIMTKVGPCLEQLVTKVNTSIQAVNTCHQNVLHLLTTVEALENGGVDDSTLSALVNDVQSLQAQVKTLQYDLARYEYRDKGLSEPIPWDDINTK